MSSQHTAEYYLSLSYPIELIPEEGSFFARHPDLDGCISQGDTADEAVKNLGEARSLWIEARLEDGLPVPEPLDTELSGRFLVRTTPGLHGQLTKLAQREGVSLNQLVNMVLAEYVGGAPYRGEVARLNDVARRLETATALLGTAAAIPTGPMPAFEGVPLGNVQTAIYASTNVVLDTSAVIDMLRTCRFNRQDALLVGAEVTEPISLHGGPFQPRRERVS
jgi:antitoxin HicB